MMKTIFMTIALVTLAALGVAGCDGAAAGCPAAFLCGSDEDAKKDVDYAYEACIDECDLGWPFPAQADKKNKCYAQCGGATTDVVEADNGPDTHDNGGGTTDTVITPDITEEVDTGPVVDSCEKLRMIEGEWRALENGEPIAGKATMVISLSPEGTQCRVTMTGHTMYKLPLLGTELPLVGKHEAMDLYLLGDANKIVQRVVDPEQEVDKDFIPECSSSTPPLSCPM